MLTIEHRRVIARTGNGKTNYPDRYIEIRNLYVVARRVLVCATSKKEARLLYAQFLLNQGRSYEAKLVSASCGCLRRISPVKINGNSFSPTILADIYRGVIAYNAVTLTVSVRPRWIWTKS